MFNYTHNLRFITQCFPPEKNNLISAIFLNYIYGSCYSMHLIGKLFAQFGSDRMKVVVRCQLKIIYVKEILRAEEYIPQGRYFMNTGTLGVN